MSVELAGYPDRIGRLAGAALGGYAALLAGYVHYMVEWCRQWGFADPDAAVLYVFASAGMFFLLLAPALRKRSARWVRVFPGVCLPATLILYILIRRSVVLTGELTEREMAGLMMPAGLIALSLLFSLLVPSKPDRPRWRMMPVGFVLTAFWIMFMMWAAPLEDQIWLWLGAAAVHYVLLMADAPERFWFSLILAIPLLVLSAEFRGAFPLAVEAGGDVDLIRPHEQFLRSQPETSEFFRSHPSPRGPASVDRER